MIFSFELTDEEVKLLTLDFQSSVLPFESKEIIFEDRLLELVHQPIDEIVERQQKFQVEPLLNEVKDLPPQGIDELKKLLEKYKKPIEVIGVINGIK